MAFPQLPNLDDLKRNMEGGLKAAQQQIAGIKVEEIAHNAAKAAEEGAAFLGGAAKAGIGAVGEAATAVGGVVGGAAAAVGGAVEAGVHAVEQAIDGSKGAQPEERSPYEGFAALLWCLAHADGEVSQMETEKLAETMRSIDPRYDSYAASVEADCRKRIQAESVEFGWKSAAKLEAKRIIGSMDTDPQGAKLLCWNLLAIAYSDGVTDSEKDFIRYSCSKAGLDDAVFEELCAYNDALVEIARLSEHLRETGCSEAQAETTANLANRERTIIEAAQALITDR